jgi:hypothetical protein
MFESVFRATLLQHHTIEPRCRKAEYQVLYVEDQLMSEAEQEDSKIIRADERF